MSMKTPNKTASDILRDAIINSEDSHLWIQTISDVNRNCIRRFLRGEEINTRNFDRLAEYFDLTLTPAKASKAKRKG